MRARVSALMLGVGLALVLTAPLLDLLSQRTERRVRGFTVDEGRGLHFELVQSLKGALFFALAVLGYDPQRGLVGRVQRPA